jgi:general secretion pathway protein C
MRVGRERALIRTIVVERWSHIDRLLPRDVYLWCKALLLALIATQAARLFWTLVVPVGPFGDWRPAQARILPQQMQVALLASVDPFNRTPQTIAAATPTASTSGLQLFGVRQEGSAGGGSAIIGSADGEQTSFVVGDEVVPGVKLAAVAFDYVLLDRGGSQERLAFPGETVAEPAPSGGSVATAAPAPAVGTPLSASAIRQGVTFGPRTSGAKVTGILVNPGRNPALFQSAGFRSGDVIVAVNGARISSPVDVAQLQNALSPGARLGLSVERGSQIIPISLNIAGN